MVQCTNEMTDSPRGSAHGRGGPHHPPGTSPGDSTASYLLWNTMVSEEIASPQFAVLNALIADRDWIAHGGGAGGPGPVDHRRGDQPARRQGPARQGARSAGRPPLPAAPSPTRGTRTHRKLTVRTAHEARVSWPRSPPRSRPSSSTSSSVSRTPRRGCATRRNPSPRNARRSFTGRRSKTSDRSRSGALRSAMITAVWQEWGSRPRKVMLMLTQTAKGRSRLLGCPCESSPCRPP